MNMLSKGKVEHLLNISRQSRIEAAIEWYAAMRHMFLVLHCYLMTVNKYELVGRSRENSRVRKSSL